MSVTEVFQSPAQLAVCSLVGAAGIAYGIGLFGKDTQPRYAPGPKPHPLVGHTFQVPTIKTWRYFEQLYHQYGPLVRLSLAGDDILVLSEPADAEELLGKRSQNYSSRRPLIYAGKHQSKDKRLVLLPYGDRLKRQRTAFHQMLQPKVVGAYEVIQELESLKMLVDMINRPEDPVRNTRRFAASLVFTLSYGKRLGAMSDTDKAKEDDSDLDAVMDILNNFVQDTYPGAHLIDTFPSLDYLPDFLAPWRATAHKKHLKEMKLYHRLVLEVKEKMDQGIQLECFSARLWDQKEEMSLDLDELSYVAGTAFEAGTDTTAGTVQWFIMAMLLYPRTMARAQAELDRVLGADGRRMPTFNDMDELPYCSALTKETFRWAPAAPGGFPHFSDAEDEYKGYKINKGTMVIPCIWSMHHNETEFPNAYTFEPERFLKPDGKVDPLIDDHYAFGFGRRRCPGQHMGAKTIWIGVTRLLWAFDIKPGLDAKGNPISVDPNDCTSGMTSKPVDFPVRITPRSPERVATILREWELQG